MIPKNQLPSTMAHAIHLHAPTASGGKDWVGAITHDPNYGGKLWVVNGKTKEVLSGGGQGRAVKAPGTEQALAKAVRDKLNSGEGYTIVDEYEARCGWHSQLQQQGQTSSAAPVKPAPRTTQPPAAVPLKILEVEEKISGPTMCW